MNVKQPASVRGNKIACINYQMCPACYGCRAYDSRDEDCIICKAEDAKRGKRYNLCNKELHEEWKINKLITKTKIELPKVTFVDGGK
jgi:hypothetical protein